MEKECVGGHGFRRSVPCYQMQVSCGRTCDKLLGCGLHRCHRVCHGDSCLMGNAALEGPTELSGSCGQTCGKKRQCEHLCQARCHPGRDCPAIPCKQKITISCPCKRRSVEVECLQGGDEKYTVPRELLCDEQCQQEERNRQLAEAFGSSGATIGMYPELLVQLGYTYVLCIAYTSRDVPPILLLQQWRRSLKI